MNGILKIVLSLSLSGSLLILVLLLCKPLFKHKTSKQWQYYIWLVVIARLLLPLAPAVNPVGILFQSIDGGLSQVDTILPSNIAAAPEMAGAYVPSGGGQATTSSPPGQTVLTAVSQNLWLIWLVAALLLLIRKMTLYQDFVHYIKAGRVAVSDPALLDRVAQIGGQAGVKRPVELYTNPLIASPLLIGFFRPCIVLPTTALPESDFQYTILHELTHYKRRDLFYKWLLQLTVCLHWFNPLVYLMSRELNRACDLSCDEAVISRLDKAGQRAYGDTLLNAIGLGGIYRASIASVMLQSGSRHLSGAGSLLSG